MQYGGPWYVPVGENRWEPYDSIAIERMLSFGAITLKTPLWREGMDGAAPLETFDELLDNMRGDHRLGLVDVVATTYAGAWRRFFARLIDLALVLIPALFLIASFTDFFDRGVSARLTTTSVLLTLLAVLLEVPVLAWSGSTPGKWLMGVKLRRQNGSRIDFRGLVRRNLRLWYYGLGAGIPIAMPFTLWFSRERGNAGELVRWDEETLHRTRRAPDLLDRLADRFNIGWSRSGAGWINPITRQVATLQPSWRVLPEQTMPDKTFYVFGAQEAVVIFARDVIPLIDLDLYADIVRTRMTTSFQGQTEITRDDGSRRVELLARDRMSDTDFDITNRIWHAQGDEYWRLVIYRPMGKVRAGQQALKVADALEATVTPRP
ncbi:RDD family protein [Lacibacterium aquatile]|uniref:RDD family protein n=1 Tax=Lacibacterium aquatile TaxID=1168082 RepID=A0ABW5DMD6_9PROT